MKNKIAAGVLALVLGVFGIHRFYLGQTGKGILYALFFWFPITWIVAFFDGIIFLTMDDNEFNKKYNSNAFYGQNVNININTQGQYRQDSGYPQQRPIRQQQPISNRPIINDNNPYKEEGTKLYREYDFKGAIAAYLKSLKVQPKDPQIHFNLACLYSLEEDTTAAFMHLQKAVEQGYAQFDKIRTHDHLAFLRTQPEFENFVKNGYTLAPKLAAQNPKMMDLSDDVIQKLERLAQLKSKGILTEEEFQFQKKKLLS
jgi:TM2 domain-containing membrane protein YozV